MKESSTNRLKARAMFAKLNWETDPRWVIPFSQVCERDYPGFTQKVVILSYDDYAFLIDKLSKYLPIPAEGDCSLLSRLQKP